MLIVVRIVVSNLNYCCTSLLVNVSSHLLRLTEFSLSSMTQPDSCSMRGVLDTSMHFFAIFICCWSAERIRFRLCVSDIQRHSAPLLRACPSGAWSREHAVAVFLKTTLTVSTRWILGTVHSWTTCRRSVSKGAGSPIPINTGQLHGPSSRVYTVIFLPPVKFAKADFSQYWKKLKEFCSPQYPKYLSLSAYVNRLVLFTYLPHAYSSQNILFLRFFS